MNAPEIIDDEAARKLRLIVKLAGYMSASPTAIEIASLAASLLTPDRERVYARAIVDRDTRILEMRAILGQIYNNLALRRDPLHSTEGAMIYRIKHALRGC